MCTLAIALRTHRRWPIVIAANRDERLGRPSEPWALREPPQGPRHAAPLDVLAGGTWIGVSSRGVVAALTNFHAGPDFPDPRRRSRGELVIRALAHDTAAAARADVQGWDAESYNPFHLVVADATHAFLWRYDGDTVHLDDLGAGLHIVTESSHDGRTPRGELVRARWPFDPDPLLLREVLVQHANTPRDSTCIHLDPHYGTRSATILRLAPTLAASDLLVTNGHPCTAPLEDRSALLSELGRSPRAGDGPP